MTLLDDSVSKAEDGTWTFQCPGVSGSGCGDHGVPFFSTRWPTRKAATARGQQHFDDHKGTPMPEMSEFIEEQGLFVDDDGLVKVKDL